ncbi:MAG: hypothetical protein RL219_2120 [Actinomycetota bacterium]|jgi:hypothetical protein
MAEVLDGEAVIIDLATGRYHAAAGVAATVWAAASAGASFPSIMATIAARHSDVPADAEHAVRAFLAQTVAAGLAVQDDAAGSDVTPSFPDDSVTPWSVPVLESHDDLADLLLLDPVHDVTESGWPHAAPPAT